MSTHNGFSRECELRPSLRTRFNVFSKVSIRLVWLLVALGPGGAALVAQSVPGSREPVDQVTVSAEGGGDFKTIQEAINAAPQLTDPAKPWTIHVKPGTYRELIYVMREKRFVRLIGEDPMKTTISFGLYAGQAGSDGLPLGTFRTPTVWIDADDFTVEGLTIANTAGAVGQAVALRVDGDRVAFRHCRFQGWQDTILVNRGRHYFKECEISGAIDFIFGGATAFFDSCRIICLGNGYVTAASTLPHDAYGLVFLRCDISGASPSVRTFLGRPWRAFASTLFLETTMGSVVVPAGWDNWDRPEREKTSRYEEFANRGPGAAPAGRVAWVKALSGEEAAQISVKRVLGGPDHWEP